MYCVANHAFLETRSFTPYREQALHFGESQKVTPEQHAKGDANVKQNMINQLQSNSVNKATEGGVVSARINGVSVLKGLCWLESMRVSRPRMEADGNLKKFGPTFLS